MVLARRTIIQFGILVIIVPLQYLLTDWLGSSESERSNSIRRFVTDTQYYIKKYCHDISTWRKNLRHWIYTEAFNIKLTKEEERELLKEEPIVESDEDFNNVDYFGSALIVRSPRIPDVELKVGQVIRHKKWHYRGVIIGWDERPRAPTTWFQANIPLSKKDEYSNQPWYSILVDTRDRAPQTTYVPQTNLKQIHQKIIHPSVDEYFEGFDGQQYIMRPSLRKYYPHDNP